MYSKLQLIVRSLYSRYHSVRRKVVNERILLKELVDVQEPSKPVLTFQLRLSTELLLTDKLTLLSLRVSLCAIRAGTQPLSLVETE